MLDLGKHAIPVLSAYGVSLALLAILIVASLRRARSVKRALEEMESRRNDGP